MNLKDYVANIENWPKKGIIFRDITPILNNSEALNYTIDKIKEIAKNLGVNKIAAPEARGFIFGMPVAYALGLGFVPIRKPNKLPREQYTVEYDLEYGKDKLCMHKDALSSDDKVLIVDDLLATGGTSLACAKLVEMCGAKVAGFAFVIDLVDLNGKKVLKDYNVSTLLEFHGE